MGLWEKLAMTSLSFKQLEYSGVSTPFKLEWFSEPLECPPEERYNHESTMGTMSSLEGNPHPSITGRKLETYVSQFNIGMW